jgi:predicted phage terminase large subunit-like protein
VSGGAPHVQRSAIRAELVMRELAMRHFAHFLRYRFRMEKRDILWNWHLDLLCEVMTLVYRRVERRVLINVPFRSLKTETVEQTWQAWMILQDNSPRSSVLSAAADHTLACESSSKTLEIVSSDWFANLAGRSLFERERKRQQDDWVTDDGARRQAAGIGGTIVGKGADHLVWGDILKPEDANSDKRRTRACTWLGETFRSRLNDPKKGTITGIMQRLHELDPAGYLLERSKAFGADKWLHVKVEMEMTRRKVYAIGDFFYERKPDELMHPARIGPAEVASLKVDLGNNYEGQCNQNPIKMKGSYYKVDWFHRYAGEPPLLSHVYQVWDYALTEDDEEGGDFSVCITFGMTKSGQLYFLDVYRAKIGSVDVVEMTMTLAVQHKVIAVFGAKGPIDKAIRPWLTKRMKETGVYFRLEGIAEVTDIVARSTAFQAMARNGNVYIPEHARWLADWLLEISAFPKGAHDDMCAAQAIIGLAMPQIRAGEVLERPPTEPRMTIDEKGRIITKYGNVIDKELVERNAIRGIDLRKVLGKDVISLPPAHHAAMEPVRYAVGRVRGGALVTLISSDDYRLSVRDALNRLARDEAAAGNARIAAMAVGELARLDRKFKCGRHAPRVVETSGADDAR